MDVALEPLAPRHVDTVVALWRRTFVAAFPLVGARIDLDRASASVRDALRRMPAWIAGRAGAVVGFAARRGPRLHHLYVDVGHQRTGLGSLLLRAARDGAPGRLELQTLASNTAGRAFYEKHGFVVVPAPARRIAGEAVVAYAWHDALLPPEVA